MTLLDPPLERRLARIETDLDIIKSDITDLATDLAVIKEQLKAIPSRWLQGIALLAVLIPIYGILVALLIQVSK